VTRAHLAPALIELLNKAEPGFIPYAFMVPLRVIRVSADLSFRTFRVEQFVWSNRNHADPKGTWRTLSTHGSETPGVMLDTAMQAAFKAQKDLHHKLSQRRVIQP
jgi:hypothetical protein